MDNKKLKEKSSYYRRRKGYNQKEMAVRLNVTPSALSKWENGRVSWPSDALVVYCDLLDLSEVEKRELIDLVKENSAPPLSPPNNSYQRWLKWIAFAVGLLLVGLIWFVLWKGNQPIWQENFDPIQRVWSPTSAVWNDVDGSTAFLKENNVDGDFGKVESEVILIDVDKYPTLRIQVKDVDVDASFTVQILDKRTEIPHDVLKGIELPGEQVVNLGQELGWQGTQSFTINIWISGEGKSIQFNKMSIEAE